MDNGWRRMGKKLLEPISKLLKQDANGYQLYKAKKICYVIFPADDKMTMPMKPGPEPFDGTTAGNDE